MRHYYFTRFTRPPRAIRKARLDNLALVPANLLPYKGQWQQVANDLPDGDILIVLPTSSGRLSQTMETMAIFLESEGRRVTTLPAAQFV